MSRNKIGESGQAVAEFALVIIAVFFLIFIIIDTSRLLSGWLTVQNSAREAARYAITGRDDCETASERTGCVIASAHEIMDALPLNESPGARYEDDNYYLIQVFGVPETGGGWEEDYAGAPGQRVFVRVIYRVPMLTPLVQRIVDSVPVYGQVVLVNESFNSLGGSAVGMGLPPPQPPLPERGPSATPTGTPTTGPTPTGTSTATATPSPTATRCDTRFEGLLVEGRSYVDLTGEEPGTGVTIYDTSLATPAVIGTATFDGPFNDHACSGFVRADVVPPLVGDHLILARNNEDNSWDARLVVPGSPTPTETPSPTPTLTPSPTLPPSATATATPVGPALEVDPTCGFTPQVQFLLTGFHWPDGETVNLYWREEGEAAAFQGVATGPTFQQSWRIQDVGEGTHAIEARSDSYTRIINFEVPCPNTTPTPPPATPTPTPLPADLEVGSPSLLSTPPIVAYQPLQFQVVISNSGSTEVSSQFFTDLYFDPPAVAIFTDTIDLLYSGGYQGISILPPQSTRVLTITAPLGVSGNISGSHAIYSMVDSLAQVQELEEENNIAGPMMVTDVTPAPSPTPSPTPGGSAQISGLVFAYVGNWAPLHRVQVWLVESSGGTVVAGPALTDIDGYYIFTGIPAGSHDLYACTVVNGRQYVGMRTGITPPDIYADLFMQEDVGGCPYP